MYAKKVSKKTEFLTFLKTGIKQSIQKLGSVMETFPENSFVCLSASEKSSDLFCFQS